MALSSEKMVVLYLKRKEVKMSSSDTFDQVRMMKMMGVTATVVINPAKLSTRIRNAAIEMIEKGYLMKGYRSQARQIADAIAQKFCIDIGRSYHSFVSSEFVPREMRGTFIEIMTADAAAYRLTESGGNWSKSYLAKAYAEAKDSIQNSGKVKYNFRADKFANQARDLLSACLTNEDRANIQAALIALRGTEPINITEVFYGNN
jgi:hypothetical protein